MDWQIDSLIPVDLLGGWGAGRAINRNVCYELTNWLGEAKWIHVYLKWEKYEADLMKGEKRYEADRFKRKSISLSLSHSLRT